MVKVSGGTCPNICDGDGKLAIKTCEQDDRKATWLWEGVHSTSCAHSHMFEQVVWCSRHRCHSRYA